jgi:hypothetical protein
MTPVTVPLVVDRIRYHRCIKHCLDPLNILVDLFIILGEMGVICMTNILEAEALWAGVR